MKLLKKYLKKILSVAKTRRRRVLSTYLMPDNSYISIVESQEVLANRDLRTSKIEVLWSVDGKEVVINNVLKSLDMNGYEKIEKELNGKLISQ